MEDKSEKRTESDGILEIYKMLVEMADRVSQRRQSANSFYLTVNTAIIGGSAYLAQSSNGPLATWAVSLAGIAICTLWIMSVISYKTLNSAKFRVITALEECLPASPFKDEWGILDVDGDGKRHKPFHKIEVFVPIVFMAVHGAQLVGAIPWQTLLTCGLSSQ